jgi:CHAD domain-containing protein
MTSPVLQSLIADRVDELFDELPGVRDGDVESIHRARVASRRLRELLPLTGENHAITAAEDIVREAGRQLGRVRDLDIIADLLARYEETVPSAAVTVALARRTVRQRRSEAAHGVVKALERLDLSSLAALRASPLERLSRLNRAIPAVGQWTRLLRDRIEQRSRKAAAATEHSAGLYFPNRLHRTRIAIKKLRYAVEVADAIRAWVPSHLIADLKKMQARLGEMHDLHVLATTVETLAGEEASTPQVAALRDAIDADILRLHRRYLERRDRLRAAIDACSRIAARPVVLSRPVVTLSTVSAVALPAALLLAGARRAS